MTDQAATTSSGKTSSQPCAGINENFQKKLSADRGLHRHPNIGSATPIATCGTGFTGTQADITPTWTTDAELNEELTWLTGTPAALANAWSYSCCKVAFWKVDWSMLPVKPAGRAQHV